MNRIWYLAFLLSCAIGSVSRQAAADEAVRPASHVAPREPAAAGSADSVTFAQQPARVGDRVAQLINTDLLVNTTVTQAKQVANTSEDVLKRRQQRFIEVLETVEGNVRRAHVSYPTSRITQSTNGSSNEEQVQPVEKRSYFVTREGKRLLVTDSEGAIPSQAEFEIVVASLQSLGLPNPLTKFLLDKTVKIGDRLKLPKKVAQELMGLGSDFGKVETFELELKDIQQIDGHACALFAASIVAVGEVSNPIHIRAFGQVIIQSETCRVVRAEMSGPLSLAVVERTPEGNFQYKANGNMRLAVESQYGHARQ